MNRERNPTLTDLACSPDLAAEVELDRIPELAGVMSMPDGIPR